MRDKGTQALADMCSNLLSVASPVQEDSLVNYMFTLYYIMQNLFAASWGVISSSTVINFINKLFYEAVSSSFDIDVVYYDYGMCDLCYVGTLQSFPTVIAHIMASNTSSISLVFLMLCEEFMLFAFVIMRTTSTSTLTSSWKYLDWHK